MEVIKCSDWVIDLGPEGGKGGGEIIAEGTPEELSKSKTSYTGLHLKNVLKIKQKKIPKSKKMISSQLLLVFQNQFPQILLLIQIRLEQLELYLQSGSPF